MARFLILTLAITAAACRNYTIVHPQKKDIVETVYASGKIIADSEYAVYALSAGMITKKLVKDGDTVKRNQPLLIIRHYAQASKMEAAQSGYQLAQSNLSEKSGILNDLKLSIKNAATKLTNDSLQYVRLKKLWQEDIGTQSNVDNAYTNYVVSMNQKKSAEEKYYAALNDLAVSLQNARSQLTSAQSDLDNYIIRSKNDGTVFQTFKEEGEAVRANDIVALLGKTSERIIRLAIDQQDIEKIKPGQDVLLRTDVTGNTIYHATVRSVYPIMNEADQTFRADAVFTVSAQQPYIHSSVEANIIIQKKEHVLLVPKKALLPNDSIRLLRNGRITTVALKTGIRNIDEVEVLSGLDASSQIVLTVAK